MAALAIGRQIGSTTLRRRRRWWPLDPAPADCFANWHPRPAAWRNDNDLLRPIGTGNMFAEMDSGVFLSAARDLPTSWRSWRSLSWSSFRSSSYCFARQHQQRRRRQQQARGSSRNNSSAGGHSVGWQTKQIRAAGTSTAGSHLLLLLFLIGPSATATTSGSLPEVGGPIRLRRLAARAPNWDWNWNSAQVRPLDLFRSSGPGRPSSTRSVAARAESINYRASGQGRGGAGGGELATGEGPAHANRALPIQFGAACNWSRSRSIKWPLGRLMRLGWGRRR